MDLGSALLVLIGVAVVVYLATVIHAATLRTLADPETALHPEERLVVWPRWLLGLILGLLGVWVLYRVRRILPPFLLGVVLAYTLDPVLDRMRARGVGRNRAISLIFVLFVLLVILIGVIVIPAIANQTRSLVADYARYVDQVQHLSASAQQWAVRVGGRFGVVPSEMRSNLAAAGHRLQDYALQGLQSGLGWLNASMAVIMLLVLTPIVSFWVLREYRVLGRLLLRSLPEPRRQMAVEVASDINHIIASYLLGVVTMVILVAAYSTVVLLILRVPFALLLGLMTGVLSLVPYFGFPVAMAVIALVMVAGGKGGLAIIIVIALHILGNVLNDYIVSPRVVGRRIGLHPLVVIFALLAGGELLGFAGLLLAVPSAAIVQALLTRFWPDLFARRQEAAVRP